MLFSSLSYDRPVYQSFPLTRYLAWVTFPALSFSEEARSDFRTEWLAQGIGLGPWNLSIQVLLSEVLVLGYLPPVILPPLEAQLSWDRGPSPSITSPLASYNPNMDACKMFLYGVFTRLYTSGIYEWWEQPATASVCTYTQFNMEFMCVSVYIDLCVHYISLL